MATPKTITAEDVQLGKLTLARNGTNLHYERRYQFLDSSDGVIDILAGGRIVGDIQIASLPANISTALAEIDAWTYAQALAQEGME